MPAGRPDTIDATYVAKAQEYVKGAWKNDGSVIPTVEGLAIYLDLARRTIYQAEELSLTLEQVQRLQSTMVINKGLTGEYNANIAKLLLSSKHGYVEKSASESTIVADVTSNGETVGTSQLDTIMQTLKDTTAKQA